MHFYLEQGLNGDTTRLRLKQFVEQAHDLAWLSPPDFSQTLNVNYVLATSDSHDHIRRVREWGQSVYACWRRVHASEIDGLIRKTWP